MKFIDLYAGIGGIRLGFERAFGKEAEFVFSNEIDESACKTYREYFHQDNHDPEGDITKIESSEIPDFDILLAGFPCQAFSIAGRKEGFADIRGTHFFEIKRIIEEKRPKAFLLENVKHFENHDKKRTFSKVKSVIEDELGYTFYHEILNAKDFGLPQNRERIYMVGFKEKIHFEFPKKSLEQVKLKDKLESNVGEEHFLSQRYLDTLKRHRARHEEKGHGFGYIILNPKKDVANTLVLGGMGKERNLIVDKQSFKKCNREEANSEAVRCLTPPEFLNLQGFPKDFPMVVSKTQICRQAANSVAVPVIEKIALLDTMAYGLDLLDFIIDHHVINRVREYIGELIIEEFKAYNITFSTDDVDHRTQMLEGLYLSRLKRYQTYGKMKIQEGKSALHREFIKRIIR